MSPQHKGRGFTLLELLVAISIFAVISLGGYQMLRSLMDTQERVEGQARFQAQLNLALAIIGRDFKQLAHRPIQDLHGEPREALVLGGEHIAELTRAGWRNPGARPRSRLQRVAYTIDYQTGALRRRFWLALDPAQDSQPVEETLLTEVQDFQVRPLLPEAGAGQDAWPPAAVEVAITSSRLGEVRRVFPLPDLPLSLPRQAAQGQGR